MCFWPKLTFFETFIKINSIFVDSNGHSEIVSFCLVFRAFLQINSTASWPTVGGGPPFVKVFFFINSSFKMMSSLRKAFLMIAKPFDMNCVGLFIIIQLLRLLHHHPVLVQASLLKR